MANEQAAHSPKHTPSAETLPQNGPAQALDFDALNRQLSEVEQEASALDPQTSLFVDADPELMRVREREYKDIEKQHVRIKMWLKVARDLAKKLGRPLRYLTLPSYYRLDVSLLLREKLIQETKQGPDGKSAEVYVAAFEVEPTKFGRMQSHQPAFKLFARTSIEEALVDGTCPYYNELTGLFPFDLINLDLTTSLTPKHEGPYSQTMEAIEAVMQRQAPLTTDWGFFLTFRNVPGDWEAGAMTQLMTNLQKNLVAYPKARDAFIKRYGCNDVEQLRSSHVKRCISQAVAKWIVDRAHYYGHQLYDINCAYYRRYPTGLPPYFITKQTFCFKKGRITRAIIPTKEPVREGWMEEDIIECIEQHKCHDIECDVHALLENRPGYNEYLEKDINDLCSMINT
jgi:hypothetical protein